MYNQKLNKIIGGGLNFSGIEQTVPKLVVRKIGIISRDYREAGGVSDFYDCFEEVLKYFDVRECALDYFSKWKGNIPEKENYN